MEKVPYRRSDGSVRVGRRERGHSFSLCLCIDLTELASNSLKEVTVCGFLLGSGMRLRRLEDGDLAGILNSLVDKDHKCCLRGRR